MSTTPALRLDIMTPFLPDIRRKQFGVTSPTSPAESYNTAFPSWPNRPCLDSRASSMSSSSFTTATTSPPTTAPSSVRNTADGDFLAQLRRQPRPDECFEDDSDDDFVEEDTNDSRDVSPSTSTSSSSSGGFFSARVTPQAPQANYSLLSRALSGARRPPRMPIRSNTT